VLSKHLRTPLKATSDPEDLAEESARWEKPSNGLYVHLGQADLAPLMNRGPDLLLPPAGPFRRPLGGSCGGMNGHDLPISSVVLTSQPHYGWVQASVARYYLPAL
jgi:hypothetical protein